MTTIVKNKKMVKPMFKTCRNCLREEKVFLVDLNLYNKRRRKIKFKQCKKDFCAKLILDKISINVKKLKW